MERNLLLVSNSKTQADPRFLGYCQREVQQHFDGVKTVLFIPYAEPNAVNGLILEHRKERGEELGVTTSDERREEYTAILRPRFKQMGLNLVGIHEESNPIRAVMQAEGVYIGGGNTFDLLRTLYANGLFHPLQRKVQEGMPYLGVSAGTVVAGMNIGSSNDNVKPVPSIDALELVPFCIKPHYLDPLVLSNEKIEEIRKIDSEAAHRLAHQGEQHFERVMEFHHHFPYTVVGLREGGILQVKGDHVNLIGTHGARILRQDGFVTKYQPAEIYEPGASLDFLLENPPAKVSSNEILWKAQRAPDSWWSGLSEIERYLTWN